MKQLLCSLAILLFLGCSSDEKKPAKPSDLIPENSGVVIQLTNIENFNSDLKNNDLLNEISSNSELVNLKEYLTNLNTKDTVLIALSKFEETTNYSLITRLKDSLFGETSIDSLNHTYRIIDSVLVVSNDQNTLDSLQISPKQSYDKMMRTADSSKSFGIYLPKHSFNDFGKGLIESTYPFASEGILEASVDSDQLLLSGIIKSQDSSNQLSSIFRGSVPQINSIQYIVPQNAQGFKSFSYSDFENIHQKLLLLRQEEADPDFNPELFQTISEIAEIEFNDDQLLAIRSIDGAATKEALRNHTDRINTYRNVDLISFGEPDLFKSVFNPLVKSDELNQYIQLDDYFIFSNSEDALYNVIANYQNGTNYANSDAFASCEAQLSDASSMLVVTKSNGLRALLGSWLGNIQTPSTNNFTLSAFQLVQDLDFAHFNGVIKKHKKRSIRNTITEMFSVELEADVIFNPQFVRNHRTGQMDIVVQDVNNTLYLISNSGKVLWKKRLIGAILGKVEQVDLYRNGRLQLAFATPFRVYVIDRNGNNVSPFPMKFGEQITQPLSVFDYDNNRRYRFLVTQGKDLLMYDRNARFVKGFRYINPNIIKTQPKHIRIGGRDYIVFAAGKRFMILNRRGSVRVGVSERFNFSGEEIFLYKNRFTTTAEDGTLIEVAQNGKVTKTDINLENEHQIYATAKTLVTLSENKLNIKEKSVELDFGEYTEPVIHYLNDKIYVTLTDLQSQKVYLFDSQAEPIANFPVYGNSTIDLANADSDSSLEFVTRAESNSIVMYKKN